MSDYIILGSEAEKDYALLDSGDGEKLERYGSIVISRPDPQALWRKNLPNSEWNKAVAFYGGEGKGSWRKKGVIPDVWPISFGGLDFNIRLSAFKHTGIFPEHKPNWEWTSGAIRSANRKVSVLNLFGYTGGATLAALEAGAEVTHLDGSKVAINWAKENAKISGLEDRPVRWMLDDAMSFVKKEIKRGRKYDGIIMDPPAYGHGPEGEVWQIEKDLPQLIELCGQLLSGDPLFILMNGYASGYSAIAYGNMLSSIVKEEGARVEIGEITIKEQDGGRALPAGIFARCRFGKKTTE